MTTKTHQEYAAFLESLRVKNEGPETNKNYQYPFNLPDGLMSNLACNPYERYLLERLRRAEANAKPPTLVEDVKAFMRAGMDAQAAIFMTLDPTEQTYAQAAESEFRRLSEPSKDST